VLSERLREGGLVIVENFELSSHKTREFAETLDALGLNGPTLLVDAARIDNLVLSSRNLRGVTLIAPGDVNVYNLLTHEQVAITSEAAAQLDKQLSNR
jgi:large subunit ribosomal protein L4